MGLEKAGWHDAFRHMYGNVPIYSWYSPNGHNGFRLDEAFIHRSLIAHVQGTCYDWGKHDDHPTRRDALSDHAAVIVDIKTPKLMTDSKPYSESNI